MEIGRFSYELLVLALGENYLSLLIVKYLCVF